MDEFEPISHEREPERVLKSVVVVLERLARVERRVDVDALHLAGELLLQRLQRKQVVAVDQAVVEEVLVRNALRVGQLFVLEEDARLQAGPILLADPGQLQSFQSVRHCFFPGIVMRSSRRRRLASSAA